MIKYEYKCVLILALERKHNKNIKFLWTRRLGTGRSVLGLALNEKAAAGFRRKLMKRVFIDE